MKDEIKSYIPYLILISIILANLLIYTGLIKLFFDGDPTIIAGVIAFVGAIFGGFITLAGVNKTIQDGRRKEEKEQILLKLNYTKTLTSKLSNIEKKIPYKDLGFEQNVITFSGLHNEIADISTSTEVLLLGEKVVDSIDSLGQYIVKLRLDTMTRKVIDYEELTMESLTKIVCCHEAIDSIKKKLTQRYYELERQ